MLNVVKLKGTITKKSPPRLTSRGEMVKCTIAVDRDDRSGRTDLIPCIAFSESAKELYESFRTGDTVKLRGRLRIDQWTSSLGTDHIRAAVLVTQVCSAAPTEKENNENGTAAPSSCAQSPSLLHHSALSGKKIHGTPKGHRVFLSVLAAEFSPFSPPECRARRSQRCRPHQPLWFCGAFQNNIPHPI